MPNTSITQFEPITIRRPPWIPQRPSIERWTALRSLALLLLLIVAGGLTAFLVAPRRHPLPASAPAVELTFEERWEPVYALLQQTPIAVKTSRYVAEAEPVVEPAIEPEPVLVASAKPVPVAPRARPRPVERDVCAQHHLRKVYVSRWSWRCRR
jgi:hypothetical protein